MSDKITGINSVNPTYPVKPSQPSQRDTRSGNRRKNAPQQKPEEASDVDDEEVGPTIDEFV